MGIGHEEDVPVGFGDVVEDEGADLSLDVARLVAYWDLERRGWSEIMQR